MLAKTNQEHLHD